ncbi:hypothetical protein OAH12_02120 [Cyclobacteriaceae bacterium]|nr:hypothetical protein [Cyclobacteriaceae bacterium]
MRKYLIIASCTILCFSVYLYRLNSVRDIDRHVIGVVKYDYANDNDLILKEYRLEGGSDSIDLDFKNVNVWIQKGVEVKTDFLFNSYYEFNSDPKRRYLLIKQDDLLKKGVVLVPQRKVTVLDWSQDSIQRDWKPYKKDYYNLIEDSDLDISDVDNLDTLNLYLYNYKKEYDTFKRPMEDHYRMNYIPHKLIDIVKVVVTHP